MPSKRYIIQAVLLVCISMFFGYAMIEAAYRVHEYRKIRDPLVESIMAGVPKDGKGTSVFDVYTGYRYRANMEVNPPESPFPVHYHTNSHGLVAREDFPVEKPAGEFRIGFVGDSYTAGVVTTIRWVDIVEDELNASEKWRHYTGGRHTRCINFGLDGIGTVQFAPVVENMVRPYGVDILVINMLKDDVARRPYHRGFQSSVSKAQVVHYVDELVARLPWWGIYPEVIAVTAGKFFGMTPRLSYTALGKAFWGERYYDTGDEAAEASVASINRILHYYPHTLFLVDPAYRDYTKAEEPIALQSFDGLIQRTSSIHWVRMDELLPKPVNKTEVDSWFNVPYDQHKNAKGTKIYGETVANYLIEHTEDIVSR